MNFETLKQSLKKNINVAEKAREFLQKLEELQEMVHHAGVKFSPEVYKQRVQRVTEGLNSINKAIKTQTKKFDEINAKLHQVAAERKRKFEETLSEFNRGIGEFCSLAFDDKIHGMLEIVNEAEPYLGDIIYYWRTQENPEQRVAEVKPDPMPSLALLFAILKHKKQKFVVLNEAARHINDKLEKFFQQQNHLQVISLTSQMGDDHSNYIILPKSQSFAVTRIT